MTTRTRTFEIRARTLAALASGVQEALSALPLDVAADDVDLEFESYSPFNTPTITMKWEEPDPNW